MSICLNCHIYNAFLVEDADGNGESMTELTVTETTASTTDADDDDDDDDGGDDDDDNHLDDIDDDDANGVERRHVKPKPERSPSNCFTSRYINPVNGSVDYR